MAARSKSPKAGPEVKTVEYAAPGVAPDVTRDPVSIDGELEEIRDAEAEANKVDISGSREDPTIDPALVEARDAEIKRAGGQPVKKAPAKKPAPSRTSK